MLAASAPAPASAGAWIAAEGGQNILSATVGERGGIGYYESSAYWEAPLSPEASVVASPWAEHSAATLEGWRGEATFALKHALPAPESMALAVQGGGFWISDPPSGCGEGGVEARVLAGRAWGAQSYLNAEAAQRVMDGGCANRRLDLTVGWRPASNWLVAAEISVRDERGGAFTLGKVALVRFGGDGRGVEVGVRARLDGDHAEPALVLSFWRGAER